MLKRIAWIVLLGWLSCASPALAQETAPMPSTDDLKTLETLLAKPEVQDWLRERLPRPQSKLAKELSEKGLGEALSGQVDDARAHLHGTIAVMPAFAAEFSAARARLARELQGRPIVAIAIPLLTFAGLGFGVEWLFWQLTASLRRRMKAHWLDTPSARLRGIGLRLLYGLGELIAFMVGSIGAFMLFEWPLTLQRIVLAYLMVFLGIRFTLILLRVVLSIKFPAYRLLPMSDVTAHYWLRWVAAVVAIFIFGRFTLDLLPDLAISQPARDLVDLLLGFVQLILLLTAIWRAPLFNGKGYVARKYVITTWAVTLYCCCLWVSTFFGTGKIFDVGVTLLVTGVVLRGLRLAVNHILRQPAEEAGAVTDGTPVPSARPVAAIALHRGLALVMLLIATFIIADILDFNLDHLAGGETLAMRLARGALNAAIIALAADCLWHMCKAWIDVKLQEAAKVTHYYGDAARKNARMRTLLPILKNMISVVLAVMAGLMILAALGVEIGPLIAGAGVVGVAIGFGAQTLVKDIISGIFFLFDDAFRAGEYIESGPISGTVEAFSVRSIKLRHALGALHTIPLGSLTTITNYSRDWVIDQMMMNVPYDTDLEKLKDVVREVGAQLKSDDAFGRHIIDPLRLQGVERFGDYGIQICLRTMTKPGEQHDIRRRAYVLLKQAFAENGITFANPTYATSVPTAGAVAAKP